ncbi:hypothetical protein NBM05_00880 [Rothia sp. AR01]|uniref:YbaK/aminoacyl-tRNA synthetase-associated domain-containing protein n=1 Tax=Rothia santali TaxID=2949643 RepID=A0A9X2HAN1_9MICC|nr:YbaK/EbsC family protein [Rothia santali]MCP3424625.1 hypothetical protein [Rothia santali]
MTPAPEPHGPLDWSPALEARELLGEPVAAALERNAELADEVHVARIDPSLADTEAFCAAYSWPLERSANCVVVKGRRGEEIRTAACIVLSTDRADLNKRVRKLLDVRKLSFMPHEEAVASTRMEHGGIGPLGLPGGWPVYVDEAVGQSPWVVVGSGIRGSKLALPGGLMRELPGVEVLDIAL